MLICLTSNTNDGQRLGGKECKHDRSQNGCEQNLIDPEAFPCLCEHVQGKGECGKDTGTAISLVPSQRHQRND